MRHLEMWEIAKSFATRFTRGLARDLAEDIKQECWIAVHRAVVSFDPGKGASLKSWVYFHVQDQLGRFRRAEQDGMRPFCREDRPRLIDVDYLYLSYTDEQDVMLSCKAILNEHELEMLINESGLNGQPETIKHMAKVMGITRVKAAQYLKSARLKMKESLRDESRNRNDDVCRG